MTVSTDSPVPLPAGLYYSPAKGIVVEGIVARQLVSHPIGPRPGRSYDSCSFNDLAGNTALSMFLGQVEPGGTKCGHRHFDETLMLFLSGAGYSEFRQDDTRELTSLRWAAGDLLVIPCNAWHEHFNDLDEPARYLSFKTAGLTKLLVGDDPNPPLSAVRLHDRYDDEPDYFSRRQDLGDGTVEVNHVRSIVDDVLPAFDPHREDGAALQHYVMGGQRALRVTQTALQPGGQVQASQPLAEEACVVLTGSGRTDVWIDDADVRSVAWSAGDLISCPAGAWRTHLNDGASPVRILSVSTTMLIGHPHSTGQGLAQEIAARWPAVLDVTGGAP